MKLKVTRYNPKTNDSLHRKNAWAGSHFMLAEVIKLPLVALCFTFCCGKSKKQLRSKMNKPICTNLEQFKAEKN